jgi:hypothetical protein
MTSPSAPDHRDPDLQKIDVKLPLDGHPGFDFDVLLGIFGRWRVEQGEEIIDLADYLHVPEGPGCLLVSQRWHFGVDFSGGAPGLFFSNRKGLEGDMAARFSQVIRSLLEKGQRLLGERELLGRLRPRCSELEITVNDRVRAPNTDESDARLRPALAAVLDRVYGKGACEITRDSDPRLRLGWRVKARALGTASLRELLERLG